jgi:hypothetical protein
MERWSHGWIGVLVESFVERNYMKKAEAVEVMNEIMKVCVLPRSVALTLSNPKAPPEMQNYELQIRGLTSKDWICLKEIIQKRNLSMKETLDYIVIYRQESQVQAKS